MKGSTDFLNPLIKSQVVVRTSTGKNGKVEVFELMEMHASSYDIKDTCYLATDKKLFPIKVKNIKTEQITVHTSKLDDQRTISRFSFELSKDMQQQILTSKSISFIQCAGPSMISLELYNLDIRPLKRLISSHLKGE
jgi:hypothetical protein